jgi:GH15 family glucan-1,4-alpha-glucosidase
MTAHIEDYAIVGDTQTAALVSRDGSIDWLCFPRFDSSACFARLLGDKDNGYWRIAPAEEVRSVKRRYREGTLVLETVFTTDSGEVALVDFMPPRTEEPDLLRIVEGRRGTVPMRLELVVRFDYGSVVPWVRRIHRGIRAIAGPDTLFLRTPVELHGENLHTVAEFSVGEGDRVPFDLTWSQTWDPDPREKDADSTLEGTLSWWHEWSSRCTYDGPYREAVMSSLTVLKAMTYAPTGGLVAAATTSLPEHLGGVRNWDYRYCWLRDATFTLYSLMNGGYVEEARAWREWLVNAVAGRPDEMQIMYSVTGGRRLTEIELDWLSGYEESRPVRIGNAAWRQHQLDIYGEVMDALHAARRMGLPPDENAWHVQQRILDFLEGAWERPDEGIWEVRGPQRQFTHSKVMAWVAVDRGVKAIERYGLAGDAARWRALRDEIRRRVLQDGYNAELNAFVQYFGAKEPDASLLMLPLVGFIPASDSKMRGTVELIASRLMQDGLVARYECRSAVDGLPPGEGSFLLCTFWYADNLALQGRLDEAREIYERLLDLRNDVGLLSEQYDPVDDRFLGNFPQAFSHVGLVNTATNIGRAAGPAQLRGEKEEQDSH